MPTSVTVGSGTSAPRYYYVYNGHGDAIALVDATGTAVASYAYDTWGVVTVNTESFANGWHNPYLYDGKDGVRYDTETGLYWMSVRAYDPTLGRFIARDPLGRAPLMGWSDQPYAYAGNNPLLNVDPSGQRFATENSAQASAVTHYTAVKARMYPRLGPPPKRWRNGKCVTWTACEQNRESAYNAKWKQGSHDKSAGELLVLLFGFLRLTLDTAAKEIQRAVQDALDVLMALWNFGGNIINVFAPGLAGVFDSLRGTLNTAIGVLRGIMGLIQFFGGAGRWLSVLMQMFGVITNIVEGPLSILILAGQLLLQGVMNLGIAAGYFLMNQGEEEEREAKVIGGEGPYEWCVANNGPGWCNSSVEW